MMGTRHPVPVSWVDNQILQVHSRTGIYELPYDIYRYNTNCSNITLQTNVVDNGIFPINIKPR